MPRIARLDTPGLLNHVMIRGIERRKIFKDDKDRENFIKRLSFLLPETRTQCYVWSFLSNHAHFLFRSGTNGIAYLIEGFSQAMLFPITEGIEVMGSYFKTDISQSYVRKIPIY